MVVFEPCCVERYGIFSVMNGSSVFFSVLAITERSEIGVYRVPMVMSFSCCLVLELVRCLLVSMCEG